MDGGLALRESWRAFLRGHGPAPDEPAVAPPPLFKGCTKAGSATRSAARAPNFCVVVADAARARVFALDIERPVAGPMTSELVELTSVTNPMLRAIDSATVSDSGPGRRGGAKTPLHSTPDHRDHRRR